MGRAWLAVPRRLAIAWHRRGFPFEGCQRRRGCLFIHVPKVAGTAILEALGKGGGGRHHLPWHVYRAADPIFYERAWKFAFVRNPWDRVHSAWSYLVAGGNQRQDVPLSMIVKGFGDFDRFIIEGLGAGVLRNHPLFLPQAEFVLAFDGRPAIDFLGRYESLASDFAVVADRLGLDPRLPLRNTTSSKGTPRERPRLSRLASDMFRSIYVQDFQPLGYPDHLG
jgi:hypothetical protein